MDEEDEDCVRLKLENVAEEYVVSPKSKCTDYLIICWTYLKLQVISFEV
jgi:hypothetical protein